MPAAIPTAKHIQPGSAAVVHLLAQQANSGFLKLDAVFVMALLTSVHCSS